MRTIASLRIWLCAWAWLCTITIGAVLPPPWADPTKNPCAVLPRGWQLLYWPPTGKCYKIFQLGHPCPDTMELSPSGPDGTEAECRCPPGTAQSPRDARCHKLFGPGPCKPGLYFAPVPDLPRKTSSKRRWGTCREPEECEGASQVFWPPDSRCYNQLTRGPCPKGELIIQGQSGTAECMCNNTGPLGAHYWPGDGGSCHEHYTRGPCQTKGELFLPGPKAVHGGTCGCHRFLPHYQNGQCYEIGTPGPCSPGHLFIIPPSKNIYIGNSSASLYAECVCKPSYVYWPGDGICYRLYTRGPCAETEFLLNSTYCAEIPCTKGRLYFPEEKTCYRIGTQGPCKLNQVVIFDFNTRPSIDGISYNGVCGCAGVINDLNMSCLGVTSNDICESTPGKVVIDNICYMLYTQGPCLNGQWLVPVRTVKALYETQTRAKCECKLGYTEGVGELLNNSGNNSISVGCHSPTVGLARYLNGNNYKNYKFGLRQY